MSEKPEPDLQSLAAEINHLREEFGRIGKVVETFVRHRGKAAAAEASQTAGQAWDDVTRTAEKAAKAVEQNPLTTLAAAFGLGLLKGMLFGGRRG